MASLITGVSIVYYKVCSGADQRKRQSSPSMAFLWGEYTGDRWIPNGQYQGHMNGRLFYVWFDEINSR